MRSSGAGPRTGVDGTVPGRRDAKTRSYAARRSATSEGTPRQSNRPPEEPRTSDPELNGEDVQLVDLPLEDAGVRRDAEQRLDVQGDEPLDGRRLGATATPGAGG